MNILKKFNIIKLNNTTKLVIGFLLVAVILKITNGILKDTHAYYGDSVELPLFNARVGDFSGEGESVKDGPLTSKNTDVNVILYTQMPDNPDKYLINKVVPVSGYELNEKDSNCYPAKGNETNYKDNNYYTISADGTVTVEYSEEKPTQVVCRIYYDRDKLSDVIIYAYVEDETGDRKYQDKIYKLVNQIDSSYTLKGHECKYQKAETNFTYDNINGFDITSKGPDTCYAYFSK